jgi:hypothetical protein
MIHIKPLSYQTDLNNLKKRCLLLWILILSLVLTACKEVPGSAQIQRAVMVLDPSGTTPTSTYTWQEPFYCLVTVENARKDTVVKASWVAKETNRAEPDFVIKIVEKNVLDSQVIFELVNEGHFWPLGIYQVYLFLDGKLDRILEFEVVHSDVS